MDTQIVVALIMATAGITGAVFTWRGAAQAERTKSRALETSNNLEQVKIQMEAWDRLADNHQTELERKDGEIGRKDATIAAKDSVIDDLRTQLEECRAKLRNHRHIGGNGQ
jgi:uncharacterized protein HemX